MVLVLCDNASRSSMAKFALFAGFHYWVGKILDCVPSPKLGGASSDSVNAFAVMYYCGGRGNNRGKGGRNSRPQHSYCIRMGHT